MSRYEYKVVPAPTKGAKAKGVKAVEDRFALTLQEVMNDMGALGWEYQRAETLPSVERAGLTGSTTNWRHVLVFRRELDPDMSWEPHDAENQEKLDEIKAEIAPDPAPTEAEVVQISDVAKPQTPKQDSDV